MGGDIDVVHVGDVDPVESQTIQAVGEILRDNPRGLLLARDELDGWLQSHTQHRQGRGTDRPLWLELHRAGNLFVDRLTRVRGLGATPRKGKALRSSESQSLCAVARGRPARPE